MLLLFSRTGLSPSLAGLPRAILLKVAVISAVRTPRRSRRGLGSSGFARRYSRNHCCFLFLRLLRCFSSPGSLPYTMCSYKDDGGFLRRVSPFRYLRIIGYLLLPAAFRSLSRLSSALSAKASTICSFQHDQTTQKARLYGRNAVGSLLPLHFSVIRTGIRGAYVINESQIHETTLSLSTKPLSESTHV